MENKSLNLRAAKRKKMSLMRVESSSTSGSEEIELEREEVMPTRKRPEPPAKRRKPTAPEVDETPELLAAVEVSTARTRPHRRKAVTKRSSKSAVVPAAARSRVTTRQGKEAHIVNLIPKNSAPAQSLRTNVRRRREAAATEVAPTINMPLENPILTARSRTAVRRRRDVAVPEEAPVINASSESPTPPRLTRTAARRGREALTVEAAPATNAPTESHTSTRRSRTTARDRREVAAVEIRPEVAASTDLHAHVGHSRARDDGRLKTALAEEIPENLFDPRLRSAGRMQAVSHSRQRRAVAANEASRTGIPPVRRIAETRRLQSTPAVEGSSSDERESSRSPSLPRIQQITHRSRRSQWENRPSSRRHSSRRPAVPRSTSSSSASSIDKFSEANGRFRTLPPNSQRVRREYLPFNSQTIAPDNQVLCNSQANINPWKNSTQNESYRNQYNPENNPMTRLANAIELSLSNNKDSNYARDNSRYLNRMTAKKLPDFSGDPLDWLHFKKAFDLSTELGEYSELENTMRLFDSLKGEARDATKAMFASGNSACEILQNLELRFGDKEIILEKIVNDIKSLPSVEEGKINLLDFASKLKDAVGVIKSVKSIGYLNSPELKKEILYKIPESMEQGYVHFAATEGENSSQLEVLSNFLYKEAKARLSAGIINLHRDKLARKITHNNSQAQTLNKKNVFTTCTEKLHHDQSKNSERAVCALCGRNNHVTAACRSWTQNSVKERWRIARKLNVCFNCLEKGHTRPECQSENRCAHCKNRHNSLLHSIQITDKNNDSFPKNATANERNSYQKTLTSKGEKPSS